MNFIYNKNETITNKLCELLCEKQTDVNWNNNSLFKFLTSLTLSGLSFPKKGL